MTEFLCPFHAWSAQRERIHRLVFRLFHLCATHHIQVVPDSPVQDRVPHSPTSPPRATTMTLLTTNLIYFFDLRYKPPDLWDTYRQLTEILDAKFFLACTSTTDFPSKRDLFSFITGTFTRAGRRTSQEPTSEPTSEPEDEPAEKPSQEPSQNLPMKQRPSISPDATFDVVFEENILYHSRKYNTLPPQTMVFSLQPYNKTLTLRRYALDFFVQWHFHRCCTVISVIGAKNLDHAFLRHEDTLYYAITTQNNHSLYILSTDLDGNRLGYRLYRNREYVGPMIRIFFIRRSNLFAMGPIRPDHASLHDTDLNPV